MPRLFFLLLISLSLLAGCAAPDLESAQPAPSETDGPAAHGAGEPGPSETTSPTPASPPAATPTAEAAQPTATAGVTEGSPSGPQELPAWIAYIGSDGNLRLVDPAGGEERQLTEDAARLQSGSQPEGTATNYCCPRWSSDGRLLAYVREVGEPVESGYQYRQSLWVVDLVEGESRLLLEDQQVNGFDWRPGAGLVAYSLLIPTEYFIEESPELVQGIWAVEVETGESYELVPPQRGYPLANPHWSPDGRFLGFEEVLYMEGRGQFAYYDFESEEYVAWEEVLGSYSWSPHGEQIVYDRLEYLPEGSERIWLRDRQGNGEVAVPPGFEQGYAFHPVFSPEGERLAYLADLDGPESPRIALFVVEVPAGEPRSLGDFEQAQDLSWSPDGERLVLTAGPYDQQQVLEVAVSDGTLNVLAQGSQPAWQPVSP